MRQNIEKIAKKCEKWNQDPPINLSSNGTESASSQSSPSKPKQARAAKAANARQSKAKQPKQPKQAKASQSSQSIQSKPKHLGPSGDDLEIVLEPSGAHFRKINLFTENACLQGHLAPKTLPKILPNPSKIEPKSNPEASKTTFEDHCKYKHEKKSSKDDPRGPKSLQIPPKTSPKPSQMEPKTPPNQIFKRFFGLLFSYCKFA